MALKGVEEAAGTGAIRERSILPLPEEVAAQIKSATAIVSLTGVVLELLENSLDAKATKIEASVDFARGGCSVEDNGLGIAPPEFREGGGLGRFFCTSKYYSEEACLGRNGTFLASLAAMSLLTVVSRHHEHRSQNLICFHQSKAIERQLPAGTQHEIHEKHGTRVTVRNLFGNLPVRVKQRAVVVEQKAEHERLWAALKREVVALLLSWQGQVSLKVRDADGKISFALSTSARAADTGKTRSASLSSMLNVLTQANYIGIEEWSSWVPASASTPTVSIRGAISLDPAPNKRVQFISLGIKPLSADAGHNDLYDEINRIFTLSSFGTVEDDADIEEDEKEHRQNDQRFKSDGYTNRQLKARKGVDRYPMFHLRVALKNRHSSRQTEEQYIEDEANLQSVIEVLNAMITEWLSVNHFRPRKPRSRRVRPNTASTSTVDTDTDGEPRSKLRPQASANTADIGSRAGRIRSDSRKRKRLKSTMAEEASEPSRHRAFAEWSRIKSGKADLFDNMHTARKHGKEDISARRSTSPLGTTSPSVQPQPSDGSPKFDIQPVLPGALGGFQSLQSAAGNDPPDEHVCSDEEKYDKTMTWKDPSTGQVFLLNARTGSVLPRPPTRPHSDPFDRAVPSTLHDFTKSIRLKTKPSTNKEGTSPWVDELLRTWDNPVFKPVEKGIQQVLLQENQFETHGKPSDHHTCSHIQLKQAFRGTSASATSKLSKAGLQHAQVLAQLDRKFVFVKMRNFTNPPAEGGLEAEVLVLIDQHAADERIRVEALLAELCATPPADHNLSGYRSTLGHQSRVAFSILEKPIQFSVSLQEREYFVTHAAKFAVWGILYDIVPLIKTERKEQANLSVSTLPPSISERCKSDPQLLISLLRTAVWKYAEDPHQIHTPLLPENSDHERSPLWLRRLSSCPQGLIDLINSRACRSAIMFNDELSIQQCEELVQRLSKCIFPFMCAHGRPSMVPLVDLGAVGGPAGEGFGFGVNGEPEVRKDTATFVKAWKTWKGT